MAMPCRVAQKLFDAGAAEEAVAMLIGAAAELGDAHLTRRLTMRLLALQEAGGQAAIPPTVWQAMVSVHAHTGDVDAAFAMLGRLDAVGSTEGLVPLEVYEVLVEGLVKSRRFRTAMQTFRRIQTCALLEPTPRLYTAMITACGRIRDPTGAQRLFAEAASKQEPGAEMRARLTIALASRERTAFEAFRVFEESMRRSEPLTLDVCRALADACRSAGLAEQAKFLCRQMLAHSITPDATIRASVIRAFGQAASRTPPRSGECARLMAHAWRIVGDARAEGRVPVEVARALLSTYTTLGWAQHAESLLDFYPRMGCAPEAEDYELVLQAMADDFPQFHALWSKMLRTAEGVSPLPPTLLTVALDVATKAQDTRMAQGVLELMYGARLQPSPGQAELLKGLMVSKQLPGEDRRRILSLCEGA